MLECIPDDLHEFVQLSTYGLFVGLTEDRDKSFVSLLHCGSLRYARRAIARRGLVSCSG